MYSVHKTFEKGVDGKRAVTLYTYNGTGEVQKLGVKEQFEFIKNLVPGTIIRLTSVNALDGFLLSLEEAGAEIQYAHWHDLGIEKGLEPKAITEAFYNASADNFKKFMYRQDLADLRNILSIRNSILLCYGDAVRRVKQTARNMGLVTQEDMDGNSLIKNGMDTIEAITDCFKGEKPNGKMVSLDTFIASKAKAIPECVLFNEIAYIKGAWITAASVLSYSGGIDRFPTVASFWHYFGQHVVDGKAPKRKVGQPVTWSPNGRTVLYNLGETIIKNTNNPWRAYFDKVKAQELKRHDSVCPCKYRDGHSNARARRKTVKEIMKRFFIAAKGQKFQEGHKTFAKGATA